MGEELLGLGGEGGELGVGEDGGFYLGDGDTQLHVAGRVVTSEERRAYAWHDLPVSAERLNVAARNAAAEVGVDVLEVLRLGAVDVAREVEVVVVLRVGDLADGHHAGVAGIALILAGEGIDDLVEVLLAEAVLRAVLFEALAGINHEDALTRLGVLFVQHEDAGGDASAVKEIGRQADDGL